jgi:hypothetical protein
LLLLNFANGILESQNTRECSLPIGGYDDFANGLQGKLEHKCSPALNIEILLFCSSLGRGPAVKY